MSMLCFFRVDPDRPNGHCRRSPVTTTMERGVQLAIRREGQSHRNLHYLSFNLLTPNTQLGLLSAIQVRARVDRSRAHENENPDTLLLLPILLRRTSAASPHIRSHPT